MEIADMVLCNRGLSFRLTCFNNLPLVQRL